MRRSLVLALAVELGACVDFDAKPPVDARAADSGGPAVADARPPDGSQTTVDAAIDAPMMPGTVTNSLD